MTRLDRCNYICLRLDQIGFKRASELKRDQDWGNYWYLLWLVLEGENKGVWCGTRDRTRKSLTGGLLQREIRHDEVKTGELGLQRQGGWRNVGVFGGLSHSKSFSHHSQILTFLSTTASIYLLPVCPVLSWLLATLSEEPGLFALFVEPRECSSASFADTCFSSLKPRPRCKDSYSCPLWGMSWAQGMAPILQLDPHEREKALRWRCLQEPIFTAPILGAPYMLESPAFTVQPGSKLSYGRLGVSMGSGCSHRIQGQGPLGGAWLISLPFPHMSTSLHVLANPRHLR